MGKPRSSTEYMYFKAALRSMHVLYFNKHTTILVIPQVPAFCRNPTPYRERGWTAFESLGGAGKGRLIAVELDGSLLQKKDYDEQLGPSMPMAPEAFRSLIQ